MKGSVRGIISRPTLSTLPVGGNRSTTRRKPTTFGRALTDSFHVSVMHESVARIEPTISEVKGACVTIAPLALGDDCATEAP